MLENNHKKTVFVGLSGGVDSSVSAYLLKKASYNVVGAFIKTWQPDFIDCSWKEERRDAMRVASHLEIPFVTIDLEKEYKENVADYMISEYRLGKTPNPDVMCNKVIKFGGFLKKALEMGADFVATGHYAINEIINGKQHLLKANDTAKEQSYFLWTLNQEQLSKIIFPIGHLQKSEVRKIAKKAQLFTAEKKDSQGICFIGKIDFKDFLKNYIEEKKGDVLDENGEVVGFHSGAMFLTLGERQGFTITKKGTNDKKMYIIDKNIEKNTITISPEPTKIISDDGIRIQIKDTNWISSIPTATKTYEAQIRYHGELLKCKISIKEKSTAEVIFESKQMVASGQSVVFYDKEVCVGGGIVF